MEIEAKVNQFGQCQHEVNVVYYCEYNQLYAWLRCNLFKRRLFILLILNAISDIIFPYLYTTKSYG